MSMCGRRRRSFVRRGGLMLVKVREACVRTQLDATPRLQHCPKSRSTTTVAARAIVACFVCGAFTVVVQQLRAAEKEVASLPPTSFAWLLQQLTTPNNEHQCDRGACVFEQLEAPLLQALLRMERVPDTFRGRWGQWRADLLLLLLILIFWCAFHQCFTGGTIIVSNSACADRGWLFWPRNSKKCITRAGADATARAAAAGDLIGKRCRRHGAEKTA